VESESGDFWKWIWMDVDGVSLDIYAAMLLGGFEMKVMMGRR